MKKFAERKTHLNKAMEEDVQDQKTDEEYFNAIESIDIESLQEKYRDQLNKLKERVRDIRREIDEKGRDAAKTKVSDLKAEILVYLNSGDLKLEKRGNWKILSRIKEEKEDEEEEKEEKEKDDEEDGRR